MSLAADLRTALSLLRETEKMDGYLLLAEMVPKLEQLEADKATQDRILDTVERMADERSRKLHDCREQVELLLKRIDAEGTMP
jgi:uncharacterized coiled-coil protein SlyX